MSLIMTALDKVREETRPKVPVYEEKPAAVMPASRLEVPHKEGRIFSSVKTGSGDLVAFLSLGAIVTLVGLASYFVVHSWGLEFKARTSSQETQSLAALVTHHMNTEITPLLEQITQWGGMTLEGVVLDGENSLCLIGGKVLHLGDSWQGKKIASITQEGVTLTDSQGQTFTLRPRTGVRN